MDLMNRWQSGREAQRVQANREELVERIARAVREDETAEPLEGLRLNRSSSPTEPVYGVSKPAFCVIAQGSKEILLGDNRYRYDPAHYLIAETLDEALFETAHLIAGLAAADGAVVMSKHNELLGFGSMISGRLLAVKSVVRALDLEGENVVEEETGKVGARHRSAYRLAGALPGSVAVVISQDGGVRFVCQKGGRVTYWEQE